MDWLQRSQVALTRVHELMNDRALSDWNTFIDLKGLISELQTLCPDGVEFSILFDFDEISPGGIHYAGCKQFRKRPDKGILVNGTMDASADTQFYELYQKLGWRTAIYLNLKAYHKTDISRQSDQADLIVNNPLVLYSKRANALTVKDLHNIYLVARCAVAVLILRLGLTIVNNTYERMKTVIHGALLQITREYIYDFNQKSIDWFGELQGRGLQRFSQVFPPELTRWLQETISSGITGKQSTVMRIMELEKLSGEKMLAEVTLRRTGSFENLELSPRMHIGKERISLSEAGSVMHYLLIQDVTERWESEKLQQEMELARRMQMNLLPVSMPRSQVVRAVAGCRPANRVGGDVYDVMELEDRRMAVFLGDAVGHGVDSGLLAATAMGAYRTAIRSEKSPEQVLASIDETLRLSNQDGFITATCMVISDDGKTLDYALAGQIRPVIFRQGQQYRFGDVPTSLPLGVNLPAHYESGDVKLNSGDLISLASDGVFELSDSEGNVFEDKFYKCLGENDGKDLETLIRQVFKEMDMFRGDMPQKDDLTIVLLRIKDLGGA